MKAKINKNGILVINTESELEEFAIVNWLNEKGLDKESVIVKNDYDKVKCHEKSYQEQEEIIGELMQKCDYLKRENDKLSAKNDYLNQTPMKY